MPATSPAATTQRFDASQQLQTERYPYFAESRVSGGEVVDTLNRLVCRPAHRGPKPSVEDGRAYLAERARCSTRTRACPHSASVYSATKSTSDQLFPSIPQSTMRRQPRTYLRSSLIGAELRVGGVPRKFQLSAPLPEGNGRDSTNVMDHLYVLGQCNIGEKISLPSFGNAVGFRYRPVGTHHIEHKGCRSHAQADQRSFLKSSGLDENTR